MKRSLILIGALVVAVVALAPRVESIVRVAPRWSFTEFYVQGGVPVGSYDGYPLDKFIDADTRRVITFDGGDLYKSGVGFGLTIGQVRQHRFAYSVGFHYTRSENEFFEVPDSRDILYDLPAYELNQYDLELNFNVFLLPLDQSIVAPFVGIGTSAGITDIQVDGFDAENSGNIELNLNFGAEIRLGEPGVDRNFIAIASTNRWNIVATDDRPRYLWFGGALKYYFKL